MSKVTLSAYEQEMLDGKYGRMKQLAMENIVRYAEILGATELCKVTKAHVSGGNTCLSFGHADTYEETFRRTFFATDEPFEIDNFSEECFSQTDVGSCDLVDWKPMNHTKEYFDKNWEFLKKDVAHGVSVVGSCTPYLTGWVPLKGEHFVTTESSNVLMSNSVFGACGNADGSESVIWSAITGRTPKWGNHTPEYRIGTSLYRVHTPIATRKDWDMLGYTIGRMVKLNSNPVVSLDAGYEQPTMAHLKQFFATMAVTSGAEICHIVGITPEAPTVKAALGYKEAKYIFDIYREDLEVSEKMVCAEGSGDIQFVSLGCPHYTLEEIKHVAYALAHRRVADTVNLVVWTSHPIKETARLSGYIDMIEKAGGHVLSGGCPVVQGPECYEGVTSLAVDAGKQAHYMKSLSPCKIFYGTTDECIEAAVKGRWEGKK